LNNITNKNIEENHSNLIWPKEEENKINIKEINNKEKDKKKS